MTLLPRRARRVGPAAFAALAASTLLAAAVAGESSDEPIAWRDDYGAALAEAGGSGRLLWIQFSGPWCPNCTRMERDSFTRPAIRERAREEFVPVKLQADANMELAVGFGLSGLPATVIVDASRRVVEVHQGYLGPDELDGLLREAISLAEPKPKDKDEAALLASERTTEDDDPSSLSPAREIEAAGPPRLAASEPDPALSGYCPVSLVSEKRLVRGLADCTASHQGRLYRFADRTALERFRRDPDRYAPANDGLCPVEQLDENRSAAGDPRFGVLFEGRLYLCSSNADRQRFLGAPARYAAIGVTDRGFCPHCIAETGRYVQGDPRYSLTRQGQRYWFPDATHRDAFVAMAAPGAIRR